MAATTIPGGRVRGDDKQTGNLFRYLSPDARVPVTHPLRAVRQMTDEALADLSERFEMVYARVGRPPVPPEKLPRALLLQILCSVRSERLLMEQLQYNLLFRWFVGLGMDEPVWTPTTFTKNRERLLAGDVAQAFFAAVTAQARDARLLSDERFTVDGSLLEAAAGLKSIRPKDAPMPPPLRPSAATRALINDRLSTPSGRPRPRRTWPPRRSTAPLTAARRGTPAM